MMYITSTLFLFTATDINMKFNIYKKFNYLIYYNGNLIFIQLNF